MADIRLEHISRVYLNGLEAVKDISIEFEKNEFIVIAGADGCGKSTLLRIIAGLEEASNGNICFDGKVVNDLDARERNLAMVLENSILYPDMTVRENLSFTLKMKKKSKVQIEEAIAYIADIMKLTEFLDSKPEELSDVMTTKVILARALIKTPDVLLLDEPNTRIPLEDFQPIAKELEILQQKLGITLILVTSDPEMVKLLGKKTVIMDSGVICQTDLADRLFENPANLAAAKFLYGKELEIQEAQCQVKNSKIVLKYEEGCLGLESNLNEKIANYNKKEVLLCRCQDKIYFFDSVNERRIG